MSQDQNVSSVRTVSSGVGQATQSGPKPEISLTQARKRWAQELKGAAGLPWSEVQEEMLRDFLKASCGQVEFLYGDKAASKCGEVIGIALASRGQTKAAIRAAWPDAGASFSLEFQVRAESHKSSAPMVEFGVDGPTNQTEQQVRDGLRRWAEQTPEQNRFLLDPVSQLPGGALRAMVAQVELLMGAASDKDNQFDSLLVSSGLLLMWKQLEARNAIESEIVMAGLVVGNEEIAAGKEVALTCRRVPLDPSPIRSTDDTKRSRATVRFRPS